MLPSTYAFGLSEEGKAMFQNILCFAVAGAHGSVASVKRFRASLPPRDPIEHARKWAVSHRPKY